MRLLAIFLLILLASVQYHLWFGKNSLSDYSSVSKRVEQQLLDNSDLEKRNQVIEVKITDLRSGLVGIEAVARNELGMIKKGEIFYRMIQAEDK